MVNMEMPSADVQFLRSMMPRKPRHEIYSALCLAKQGKTLFYRDFQHHLHHSSARLRNAPGFKGMVMLVFFLPSFPYDRHKRCQARPLQKLKRKSDV